MTRTNEKIPQPCFVEDKHLQYLDALRESGATNMFGAVTQVTGCTVQWERLVSSIDEDVRIECIDHR